jgi:membrane-bound serine protease (ClpP class)
MNAIIGVIVIALVLFFLEIFMPGGVLAMIGAVLVLVAAFMAYPEFGAIASLLILLCSTVLGIGLFFLEVRLLKSTRFGRQFMLESVISGTSNQTLADDSVVGRAGTALTTMNPSGKVEVEGESYTASSMSGLLEKGASVSVVRVDQFKLIVKKS